MAATIQPLASLLGNRQTGQDVRSANVAAVQAVANVVRSSLGPRGLDKMMVNDVGDVTVTNDGATILKQLEVQHPAARVLVDLSDLQDQEVGDGTTSVVLLAAELLARGNALIKRGIHPTNVIAGYKLAMRESVAIIKRQLAVETSTLGSGLLEQVAATTLSSKLIGAEAEHFARIVVEAVCAVKTETEKGQAKYPVNAISVLKAHGCSARESYVAPGYALPRTTRVCDGMPRCVKGAKVALLDFNLRQHRMQFGVQIEISDPAELERVRQKERDITKAKVAKILAAGANVVLTTQGIDDLAAKYFVEAGVMAIRRVPRKDIRRISKATGATLVLTMADMEGEESFQSAWLGRCDEVVEQRLGDWDAIFLNGCRTARAVSLVIRGANENFLDEAERSMHDALCAVSRTLECHQVVGGGGTVEVALHVALSDIARSLGTRQQDAVAEFANAMLVIPKALAANADLDALECVAKLVREHFKAQRAEQGQKKRGPGLNLVTGDTLDAIAMGIVEPAMSKVKAIRFATEAAIAILRIDDAIQCKPVDPPGSNQQQE